MKTVKAAWLCALLVVATQAFAAAPQQDTVCDVAAQKAAKSYQVPAEILMAVARVETGRQSGDSLHPWPWAVNLGGEGHWPESLEEAMSVAQSALDEGRMNIDIGCFQLNIRWHSKGFTSLADMFDPQTNADYAAGFLAQLYRETGDWKAAVGTYHSRNADLAAAYANRVSAVALPESPVPATDNHVNRFPLLQSGGTPSAGSLFSQAGGAASPLIGQGS
jgi:hypothetical protein